MINKAVFIQVLVSFMMPLSLELIHYAIGILIIKDFLKVNGVINILMPLLLTISILLIIYGEYFYIPYLGYKNSVKER